MVYIPRDVNLAIRTKCKRHRYSDETAKAYIYWVSKFLDWLGKDLRYASKKDASAFLQKLDNRNLTGNTLNQAHMALKFLFEDAMDKRMWITIKYAKVPRRIQKVLTKEEVKKLLYNIRNHKHKIMIALMYASGLRVSELINLKIKDLNFKENYGFVRNGKGGKDRILAIPEKLKRVLIQICVSRDREDNLFLTNRKEKYNVRSLQQIVKKAAKSAGLDWKEIHCHTLRHSFATHLIEQGASVSEVQASLGHKSPETSMNYVHSSGKMIGIKSPLDLF